MTCAHHVSRMFDRSCLRNSTRTYAYFVSISLRCISTLARTSSTTHVRYTVLVVTPTFTSNKTYITPHSTVMFCAALIRFNDSLDVLKCMSRGNSLVFSVPLNHTAATVPPDRGTMGKRPDDDHHTPGTRTTSTPRNITHHLSPPLIADDCRLLMMSIATQQQPNNN